MAMRMTVRPWPEARADLKHKLGYDPGCRYEMSGEALIEIVAAGFDIMVRHASGADHDATQDVHVAPGGRGFGQR
jgi:hypothetical protein